jgi:hypothetical protein
VRVFISYARADAEVVEALRKDLEDLEVAIWFDRRLRGGEDWWNTILGQIRGSEVFVLVLSPASLGSEACTAETSYALSVNRSFLPLQIAPVDVQTLPPHVQRFQLVSYEPTGPAAMRLAQELLALAPPGPLPDPLPTSPPPPSSYGDDYARRLGVASMPLDEQRSLSAILRAESADQSHGEEALALLRKLRARRDLVVSVADEIDTFLARQSVSEAARPARGERADRSGLETRLADIEGYGEALADVEPRPHRNWRWAAGGVSLAAITVLALVIALRGCGNSTNLIVNSSFEGSTGWHTNYLAESVDYRRQPDPHAPDGSTVAAVTASKEQGSIAQDVDRDVRAGETYEFSVLVRSATDVPIDGRIGMWIGAVGTNDQEPPLFGVDRLTRFRATDEWTRVRFRLTLAKDHRGSIRAEIYLLTTGRTLLLDEASLTKD